MEKGKQDKKEGSKMTKAEDCKKIKILVPRAGGLRLRLLKIVYYFIMGISYSRGKPIITYTHYVLRATL